MQILVMFRGKAPQRTIEKLNNRAATKVAKCHQNVIGQPLFNIPIDLGKVLKS